MTPMELYADKIVGAIRGLDRVRFRGTVRWLSSGKGVRSFLSHMDVWLEDFASWANSPTQCVRKSCARQAEDLGIEPRYLCRRGVDKEALARQIARDKGIDEGSICMLGVVEPCLSAVVGHDPVTRTLGVRLKPRKCILVYDYPRKGGSTANHTNYTNE